MVSGHLVQYFLEIPGFRSPLYQLVALVGQPLALRSLGQQMLTGG